MQSIQQERAKFALEQVEAAKNNSEISQKEYKSYASSFPAMIQMNGLGQAAAFFRSKGAGQDAKSRAYRSLYDTLSSWLTKPGKPYSDNSDLLNGITQKDMHSYRLAQAEALALLDWVKKFAKAYMEE